MAICLRSVGQFTSLALTTFLTYQIKKPPPFSSRFVQVGGGLKHRRPHRRQSDAQGDAKNAARRGRCRWPPWAQRAGPSASAPPAPQLRSRCKIKAARAARRSRARRARRSSAASRAAEVGFWVFSWFSRRGKVQGLGGDWFSRGWREKWGAESRLWTQDS